jgi:hypothetical protein
MAKGLLNTADVVLRERESNLSTDLYVYSAPTGPACSLGESRSRCPWPWLNLYERAAHRQHVREFTAVSPHTMYVIHVGT